MRLIRPTLSLMLLTTLSLAQTAAAQTSTSTAKTGLAVLPTPDGALLRWFLPGDVLPGNGFVVQVTGVSSEQNVPIASPQPFSASLGVSRDEYDAVKAIYQAPLTDDNRIQRAIFNLNVVARPGYARTLGIQTTLTDLKPGAYTATVYAVNGAGRTRVGSAAFTTGSTPAVPAPSALKGTGRPTDAQLTWTPPNTPGALVVAYNVYRAGATGAFTRLDPAPFFRTDAPGGDVFRDAELKSGQTGRYQVTAVDLFGRESAPSPAITVTAQTGPVSPEISRSEAGNRTVTLDWAPPQDPRVNKVLVLRGTAPESLAELARVQPTARSYVDTTVQGGVPYLYALASVDAQGVVSGRSTLTPVTGQNLTPPAVPTGLKVTPSEKTLVLSWTANPEKDLRGYLVYRSEGEQANSRELLLTGLPIQAPTYTDVLTAGVQTRYHYRVVAVNATQIDSARSEGATAALLDKTPPPVPVLAAVAAGAGGLTLNWTQAEVPDLAGFEVTRQAGETPVVVLKTLAETARTYTDPTAAAGVVYTYSLRSLDRAGNRSQPAAPVSSALPSTTGDVLPTQLRAALLPDKGGVRLTWTAGVVPARYVVYRLSGAAPVQVSDLLSALTFTDSQGQADSRYELRAVSGPGLSAPTPEIQVTP